MDCKILRQYSLIIVPSIETKKKTKKIDFLKVLDKETPLTRIADTCRGDLGKIFGSHSEFRGKTKIIDKFQI